MKRYKPGTHVHLIGVPTGVTLNGNGGTVVGPDPDWGDMDYCIVHLDTPAIYHANLGYSDPLPDVCEMYDNLAPSRAARFLMRRWRRLISLPCRLRREA